MSEFEKYIEFDPRILKHPKQVKVLELAHKNIEAYCKRFEKEVKLTYHTSSDALHKGFFAEEEEDKTLYVLLVDIVNAVIHEKHSLDQIYGWHLVYVKNLLNQMDIKSFEDRFKDYAPLLNNPKWEAEFRYFCNNRFAID